MKNSKRLESRSLIGGKFGVMKLLRTSKGSSF